MERTWSGWSRGIYPFGIWAGIWMSVAGFLMRNWDAPVPLVVVILFSPVFALAGFRVAAVYRRVEPGAVAGAAAAATGFLIVCLAGVVYFALARSWPTPLIAVGFAMAFLLPVAMLGLLCGIAGAILARLIAGPANG